MKIFWSWQSDTPGKIGRHFVRDALTLAIEELRQAPHVEEPTAAETREGIHLDHDRQGVTGGPDLARTIFDKIDHCAVFVADVTAVGTALDGNKKLINSNVGIEYGHARQSSRNSIRRPIWPMCWSASSPVGPRATSCTNSSPGTGRRPASSAHGWPHEPAAPFVIILFTIDGGSRDAARRT